VRPFDARCDFRRLILAGLVLPMHLNGALSQAAFDDTVRLNQQVALHVSDLIDRASTYDVANNDQVGFVDGIAGCAARTA
jgi:hypothetical protein